MIFDSLQSYAYEFYQQTIPYAKIASIGGIVLVLYIPYRYLTRRRRKTPIKDDYKQGIVYLYQLPRAKCVPTISPFCLKLETWLRMADIQYENICSWRIRSLEGTVPFLEYNGREYSDSALAIRDMTRIFSKESMENHLNDEQKATARAFEAIAESSLAVTNAYFRFVEHFDELFQQLPDSTFVLCQIIYAPYDFPPKATIEKELPNLKEYCERMKARYWPDWDKCITEFTTSSDWKH
ncbi:hypothetical protein DINM_022419 [Dirofilaria immitis]|nr:hypothetical protein [Dirofilaria immitis]